MTDFRALCAELVETWDATADFDFNDFGNATADIVNRTRAALAEQPVAPTAMQILALSDEIEAEDLGTIDLVRRALARWGVPAAVPTPEAKPTPSLKEPTPIETVCYYDDPENLPYFVGN